MIDSGDAWPSYHVNTRDHMHALGVLISAWNDIERTYQAFIQLILYAHEDAGVLVGQILKNAERSKFIREQVGSIATDDEAEHVVYFIKCANICHGNRNFVAHAEWHASALNGVLGFTKDSKASQLNYKQNTIAINDLREMADACHAVHMYGMIVWSSISTRMAKEARPSDPFVAALQPSLLQKPAQPRSLDQIRGAPKPLPSQL